ncbi:MAG TPA: CZB domain-containing protein [Gallionella sp.]|nr:CZB domain-containing protein [Gallionella sp.]
MGMKNEIEEALHAHAVWRKRFKDFLNGRAPFDLATVSATDQCIFGKWLDKEGHRMIPSELHDEIRAVHNEFHQIAAGIIQKIKEKRFAEAHEDISQDGPFNQASLRLRDLLLKLSLREPTRASSSLPQNKQAPSAQGSEEPLAPSPGVPPLPNAPG